VRSASMREALHRPLRLPYHPLYRFYEGGSLSRAFRGLPPGIDDWWSEDWVGSCTIAGNPDPSGQPQGLSIAEVPGLGKVTILELVEAEPEAMLGVRFVERWGTTTGVLVKLLSPAGQVPLHAHPSRDWAQRHLGSRYGKTEAWIILEAPGDGSEPAYAGIGFREEIDREWFTGAVRRYDRAAVRDSLHRTEISAGDVFVAHGGVPHYLGPRVSFIEVQEPTDHIVIAETDGSDDTGATMGLGWELALDMIDYRGTDREATLGRARQVPSELRKENGGREVRLFAPEILDFFDATRLEVAGEMDVADGRFYIGIVVGGEGTIEGDFGSEPIRRGETFACAASLGHRIRSGPDRLIVVRCLGPLAA
jgi:mannose-6-phosphate isomerase